MTLGRMGRINMEQVLKGLGISTSKTFALGGWALLVGLLVNSWWGGKKLELYYTTTDPWKLPRDGRN